VVDVAISATSGLDVMRSARSGSTVAMASAKPCVEGVVLFSPKRLKTFVAIVV
jgi:hypothetical protein